jgi:hypothetical protein
MKPGIARLATLVNGDGPQARRALRRLVRAGGRGDQDAVDVLWDHWFATADDEVLAALTRWRRPRTGGGLSLVALGEQAHAMYVLDAVRRTGHPVSDIARAIVLSGRQDVVDAVCAAALADDWFANFCAGHHLAPADPHRAAVFFLLTGQDEKYRLADPDHSLLALAYRGARERERARIRQRAAGDHGIVLALAATMRGELTDVEARYLVDSFAERRDWPALWALAKDLPVPQAVDAVARMAGWRPPDQDAVLFDLLTGVDSARLRDAHAVVARPWSVRETSLGPVTGGSISPDGARIAVATEQMVAVCAFPPGRRTEVRRHPAANPRAVLALDDDVLVTAGRNGQSGWLARTGDSGPRYRHTIKHVVDTFGRAATGFVALVTDRDHSVDLYLQPEGEQVTGFAPRILNVHAQLGVEHQYPPLAWAMATDPGSGRIALVGDEYLHVTRMATVLHRLAPKVRFLPGKAPSLTFCGPDRVAGMGSTGELRMWRLTGGVLKVVAERQLTRSEAPACPVYLPAAGVLSVLVADRGVRRVQWFDAETLADVPVPTRLAPSRPTFQTAQGNRLMICGDSGVTVADVPFLAGVTELADRPLAATTPADLNLVRAQLDRESTDPAARPFLELLYACLVDRFAVDISIGGAIGEPGAGPVRGDDIALGGSA